ncbi:hypothetical protein ACLIBH_07385 [Virgibacillus sp. W0430]|uniref:hypothetical protein n=1 Tax=Virgibacillus sp. W0430 TaxID=3391580 RepID=UPI003F44863A
MKLHEHFLPNDLYEASKEFHSFKDCLALVTAHIDKGEIEIELAQHRSVDMIKSLHELVQLARKKNEIDRRNRLLEQMGAAGINIQVVRMYKHE